MNPYKFLDTLDLKFEQKDVYIEQWLGSMLGKLRFYWTEYTLLCVFLLAFTIVFLAFVILEFTEHKKMMSRAYWRGYRNGKKEK